jgi:hypothetical protein
MTKEFNLSEKVRPADHKSDGTEYYWQEDVKEFIRLLKDKIVLNDIYTADEIFKIINDLVGDKLI